MTNKITARIKLHSAYGDLLIFALSKGGESKGFLKKLFKKTEDTAKKGVEAGKDVGGHVVDAGKKGVDVGKEGVEKVKEVVKKKEES